MPTRPFSQPSPDQRGLVCSVVIHDEMDIEFSWHGGLDLVEELAELGGTVASVALADDPSGRNVEGGEQRCGAMPFVVISVPRPNTAISSAVPCGTMPATMAGRPKLTTAALVSPAQPRPAPAPRALPLHLLTSNWRPSHMMTMPEIERCLRRRWLWAEPWLVNACSFKSSASPPSKPKRKHEGAEWRAALFAIEFPWTNPEVRTTAEQCGWNFVKGYWNFIEDLRPRFEWTVDRRHQRFCD